jgi:hypothetical protein
MSPLIEACRHLQIKLCSVGPGAIFTSRLPPGTRGTTGGTSTYLTPSEANGPRNFSMWTLACAGARTVSVWYVHAHMSSFLACDECYFCFANTFYVFFCSGTEVPLQDRKKFPLVFQRRKELRKRLDGISHQQSADFWKMIIDKVSFTKTKAALTVQKDELMKVCIEHKWKPLHSLLGTVVADAHLKLYGSTCM